MELTKKREKTLFWMFLKQVIYLSVAIILEIIIFVSGFMTGTSKGIILPANYVENQIKKNEAQIASSETFDPSLIPDTCLYGLFDSNDRYLEGNLSKNSKNTAIDLIHNRPVNAGHYYVISTKQGYCFIQYDITAHFANAKLNRMVPHLELTMLVLFMLIFIIIVIINTIHFCRLLKKKLSPLYDEIRQIKEKNLDYEQKGSDIKEINDIFLALDDMKTALASSLKKEWETEQRRISNVSSLAHDIKTPLTIIKGNVELLKEENEPEQIGEQLDVVNTNVDKIERYIELLLAETKGSVNNRKEHKVSLQQITNEIEIHSRELGMAKQVPVVVEKDIHDRNINLDEQSVLRAIMNLVMNAVEHTDREQGIKITMEAVDTEFSVQIEDYGNGFSKEALEHAKEQFFTERMERSKEHYGLGMYSADQIAQRYNGSLEYKNKENNNGAVVLFKMYPN